MLDVYWLNHRYNTLYYRNPPNKIVPLTQNAAIIEKLKKITFYCIQLQPQSWPMADSDVLFFPYHTITIGLA